jgi:hypothetical protein
MRNSRNTQDGRSQLLRMTPLLQGRLDEITALDRQHRRQRGVEVTPMNRGRYRLQRMQRRGSAARRLQLSLPQD